MPFSSEVIFREGKTMASRFNITLPNGTRFMLLYNEEQSKRSL